MSEIIGALQDEQQDFWIADQERIALCEILTMIAAALKSGSIWFNKNDREFQQQYIDLCETIAKRFANMPVKQEN